MTTTIMGWCGHWGAGSGPGPWLPLLWLLLWGAAIAGGFLWWRRRSSARPAETVLGERYARGEIADEEYRRRLAVLKERAR